MVLKLRNFSAKPSGLVAEADLRRKRMGVAADYLRGMGRRANQILWLLANPYAGLLSQLKSKTALPPSKPPGLLKSNKKPYKACSHRRSALSIKSAPNRSPASPGGNRCRPRRSTPLRLGWQSPVSARSIFAYGDVSSSTNNPWHLLQNTVPVKVG
jgi:hypothetical protein